MSFFYLLGAKGGGGGGEHIGLTRKCITPNYDLLRTYYMCMEQIINYYNLNIVQGASTCVQCLLQEALGQINISCIRGDQHSGREHGLLPLHHLHCTTTHDHLHQSPHPTQCPAPPLFPIQHAESTNSLQRILLS